MSNDAHLDDILKCPVTKKETPFIINKNTIPTVNELKKALHFAIFAEIIPPQSIPEVKPKKVIIPAVRSEKTSKNVSNAEVTITIAAIKHSVRTPIAMPLKFKLITFLLTIYINIIFII